MFRAIVVSKKSSDLIASLCDGVVPEIRKSPYANGCEADYFIIGDDGAAVAKISTDDFFDNYQFEGPESPTEFRPITRL